MFAQNAAAPATAPYRSFSPSDQWELGVNLGLPFIAGDVDAKFPGFGGGLHVRKSLDHIFSVRVNTLFSKTKNEGDGTTDLRKANTQWISGSGDLVIALNNFRFNKPNRKILLNGIVGLGYTSYKVNYENIPQFPSTVTPTGELKNTNPFIEYGAGISFRISPKMNFGIEYTVASLFGGDADLLDGEQNLEHPVTTYRDQLHYPHLQLNFNLGGKTKDGSAKAEPLYWSNPLGQVSDAITALEARPIYDPTDTDGDGIIDAIDEEDNSPANARVDSKGVTLDSDMDKVADYKDKEPYSPPGYPVDAMGVAQVPKAITEADVNRIVDAKLANFKLPASGIAEWFLPIINFESNHYDLRYSEYEKLYQVASVLKQNPNIKVVAVGHTDKRSSEEYNNVLSYNRAKAAIDFMVAQYGISRDRLILNWSGEGSSMVPVDGSSMENRRVEFRVAKGETEMARPAGPEAGKAPKVKANKDAGY